jgi:hypothetical protein
MRLQEFREYRRGVVALLAAAVSIISSAPVSAAAAQNQGPLPARPLTTDATVLLVASRPEITPAMRREVDAWVREYLAWREWAAQWRGRTEPGWFSRRDRRPKPDPPAWMVDACSQSIDDPLLAEPCSLVTEWQSDFVANGFRDSQVAARAQQEQSSKTLWWERVHLDGFWPILQSRGTAFGLFGTHLTLDVAGRLEVFAVPGFIMLALPAESGRDWTPATDWGVAFRLGTFTLPGSTGKGMLHVNVARAWVFGAAGGAFTRYVDLVGFSVTFPQTRVPPP